MLLEHLGRELYNELYVKYTLFIIGIIFNGEV